MGLKKDDSYAKTLQFAKKNNVQVIFTGKLSKQEWIELSKDYNVFIITTHFDNTPVSIIEAIALCLPVVSTNVGGIPYLLEQNVNALLVEDDDVDGMTNQIKLLLTEPNLALNFFKKKEKNWLNAMIGKLSKRNGLNCWFNG